MNKTLSKRLLEITTVRDLIDFIEDVKRDVRRAADALRANAMPTQPHIKRCPTCDYRGMCSAAMRN